MSQYDTLADFMRANANDPLRLAKIINGWQWSSLLPGGYGPTPSDAENVADVLTASCGWRYIFTKALFAQIGIETRIVNFYNVPFQGNHTTVELYIGGKWMWFDPTFGTYFEPVGGGRPLSAAEARASWPDVVVKKSTLEGWQGEFIDPRLIDPNASYQTYTEPFFFQSVEFAGIPDVISGEVNSLYFGPDAAYRYGETRVPIPAGDRTWKTYVDTKDASTWKRYVDTFDENGKLDFRWGEYDAFEHRHYAWFIDWDQLNVHDWAEKRTYVGNNGNGVLDYALTLYDDGRKTIVDYDTVPYQADWKVQTRYYTASGALDRVTGTYDDGRSWVEDWDQGGHVSWASYRDEMSADGKILTTRFVNDDRTVTTVDWSKVPTQSAPSSGGQLTGTASRDLLLGAGGYDILVGGGGADRLEGGSGRDIYYTDSLDDMVVELPGAGSDAVYSRGNHVLAANVESLLLLSGVYGTGNSDDNTLRGNAGVNVLSGEAGDDFCSGAAGNDTIVGGAGADVLEGGSGADVLAGNIGADTFLWRNLSETGRVGSASDLVKDFSPGAGDRIHLKLVDAQANAPGNQSFEFIGREPFTHAGQIRYIQVGGETRLLINVDADSAIEGLIRISGTKALVEAWFVL